MFLVVAAVGTPEASWAAAPTFPSSATTRQLPENTAPGEDIGEPVSATDDDGDDLMYTLEGTDASSFEIDSSTGQLRTKSSVTYDHESKSSYSVTVKADDEDGGVDTIAVTITVTDVDEPPTAPTMPVLSAVPGSTSLLLVRWEAPPGNGGPAVNSYDVDYRASDETEWSSHSRRRTGLALFLRSTHLGGREPGTSYDVRVRANNDEGRSEWSPAGTGATSSSVETAVPGNWGLIPVDRVAGDRFRLLIVGSVRHNAMSSDIAVYNQHIQELVAAADAHEDIRSYSAGFRVIGSTADVDARDNAGMHSDDVPVYWLGGPRVADDYAEFYSVEWQSQHEVSTESGPTETDYTVFTGTRRTGGTASPYPLGGNEDFQVTVAQTWHEAPLNSSLFRGSIGQLRFYGISEVFEVSPLAEAPAAPEEPSVSPDPWNSDRLLATWSAPRQGGRPATESYDLEYREGSSGDWMSGPQTVAGTAAKIRSLEEETAYQVRVRARNEHGAGAWSDPSSEVSTVTPDSDPESATEVSASWSLVPAGLSAGDAFRLLFVSSGTRRAGPTDIANYNAWIQTQAGAGHTDIQSHSARFRVVGSTADTDARDNTETTVTDSYSGVPIYWLGGARVADDYEDFYDGAWHDESTLDESGDSRETVVDESGNRNWPFTGSKHDGTEDDGDGDDSKALGADPVRVGRPNSSDQGNGPLSSGSSRSKWHNRPMYGLSLVFRVSDSAAVNTAPAFPNAGEALSVPENTASGTDIGSALVATDDDGDDLTYTLEGTDASSFEIDSATGQLQTKSGVTYDHESKSSYSVVVKADDNNGGTDTVAVTITVSDVDEPPDAPATPSVSSVSGSTTSVSVSWTAPSTAGRPAIDSYDVQYRAAPTGSWLNGPQDVTGTSTTITSLEENTSYQARVRATNDEGDSGWSQPGTGSTNAPTNSVPEFSSPTATRNLDENTESGVDIGAPVSATDDDNDDLTYTLEGVDASSFEIDEAAGQLQTKSGVTYDHESKSSYSVVVKVDDGNGGTATIAVSVFVDDVDEPPEAPDEPVVVLATARDTLSVSWTAPVNEGRPAIDGYDLRYRKAGETNWTDGPQGDTGTSVVITGLDEGAYYEVQVRATNDEGDGDWSAAGPGVTPLLVPSTWDLIPSGLSLGVRFRLLFATSTTRDATSTDIADYNAFVQGRAAAGHAAIQAYSGGFRVVGSTAAVDARDNTATRFTNSVKGVVIHWLGGVKVVDDYEDFYDGDWDNETSGKDESGDDREINTIGTVPLSGSTHGGEAADGEALGSGGSVRVAKPGFSQLDHGPLSSPATTAESTTKAFYGLSQVFEVAGSVPGNNAPAFAGATAGRTIPENSPGGANVGAALTATDDDGDDLTYTLEGTDASSFEIDSATGQLETKSGVTYDHESKSSYSVIVKVDDGFGGTATITVTITVSDVDEPPDAPAAPSVSSVSGSTTSVSVSWTAPSTAGRPAIDSYDVQYRAAPTGSWLNGPQDVTGTSTTITSLEENTSYQARVRATNDEGDSGWSQPGTGSTNAPGNTAPEFSSSTATRSLDENTVPGVDIGAPVSATDDDGDDLTYTLEGVDASSFEIDGTTGQLRTRSGVTYDHESKSSYSVVVKADDGNGGTATIAVTITVSDVDEPPDAPDELSASRVSTSPTSLFVSWEAPANEGRPPVDSYDVEYREGDTGNWRPGSSNVRETSATIEGLAEDTLYQVRVRATNVEGDGAWSSEGEARTGFRPMEVRSTWPLVPSGVESGDRFRLLFVTSSERQPDLTDIEDYDEFVQTDAENNGHDSIRSYSSRFRVLGCTAAHAAWQHTDTSYTATDKGVAVYWLNGERVADDYEDLYDGLWSSTAPKSVTGEASPTGTDAGVATGCTEAGASDASNPLGAGTVVVAAPWTATKELRNGTSADSSSYSYFGLSALFRVETSAPPPSPTGGGGGGPPQPEPEPEAEREPESPPIGPLRASFTHSAPCADGLCRVLTGETVAFAENSTGSVFSRFWDFGDGRSSRSAAPGHAWAEPGFYTVVLQVANSANQSTASATFLVEASDPAGTCTPNDTTVCLRDSRFELRVEWQTADGRSGSGFPVHAGTNDSGVFWFFDRNNWELLVKLLDGCAENGHVWVFSASTTDLGYRITVRDTATGTVKEYRNEPGMPAPAITDVTALQACAEVFGNGG